MFAVFYPEEEKKIGFKAIKIFVVFIMIVVITVCLIGCANTSYADDLYDYIYASEVLGRLDAPDEWDIGRVLFGEDRIYFIASNFFGSETAISSDALFSMDINGTEISRLPNFTTPIPPDDATGGHTAISALHIDSNGYLWTFENGDFNTIEFEYNLDSDDPPFIPIVTTFGDFAKIRKLDGTGTELLSFDVSHIVPHGIPIGIASMGAISLDNVGNIYLVVAYNVYVLASDGGVLFNLNIQGVRNELIVMPDGSIALLGMVGNSFGIRTIDVENQSWGESISLPPIDVSSVFQGDDEFFVLFSDGITGLFGVDSETYEVVQILNWIDSDIFGFSVKDLNVLANGQILVATQRQISPPGSAFLEMVNELTMLTRTAIEDLPERELLNLATFRFSREVQSAVLEYNRISTTHRIRVTDYSAFNTIDDNTPGVIRLSTEIMAGRLPDILDLSNLPFDLYVARGLLVDLNPLIDADPMINRSDFFDNILRADEIDGNLYRISPTFRINTIMGCPNVLGDYVGWTFDEFNTILKANPQADVPLGAELTDIMFLRNAFEHNSHEFIDWENEVVSFDTDNFIELLELASVFPRGDEQFGIEPASVLLERQENIISGRQIMIGRQFGGINAFQSFRANFGGEIVLKGWPSIERSGSKAIMSEGLAITVNAEGNQGAWEFVRFFLTTEFQREHISLDFSFPINRIAFQDAIRYAVEREHIIGWGFIDDDGNYIMISEGGPLLEEEAEQLMSIIESISEVTSQNELVWNIISESASDFFNGIGTAQDAARVIQSRISIFMAEQS